MFNVPQFIDIEDKIVGPLTAKQMGWLSLGGIAMLIFYLFLDSMPFIICAIIIAAIFSGLAFYRPFNQPLINFLIASFGFFVRPKTYIWKRVYEDIHTAPKITKKESSSPRHKDLDQEKIEAISKVLDAK